MGTVSDSSVSRPRTSTLSKIGKFFAAGANSAKTDKEKDKDVKPVSGRPSRSNSQRKVSSQSVQNALNLRTTSTNSSYVSLNSDNVTAYSPNQSLSSQQQHFSKQLNDKISQLQIIQDTRPTTISNTASNIQPNRHNLVHSANSTSSMTHQPQMSASTAVTPTNGAMSITNNNNNMSRNASISKHNRQQVLPRFQILLDGSHDHHLRNNKRQEKLGQMVKDWLGGGKKMRSDAVSAIPNILSSNNLDDLDDEVKAVVDNAKQNNLPPTLFASLLTQVKKGDIQQYTNGNNVLQQPTNLVSIHKNKESKVESFVEKYGKCQEVIGRGTFGVVRIAHKKNLSGDNSDKEILFAVKEFTRKPTESDKKYSGRLTNEFCISSSLKHSGIINAFDLLRDGNGDYCEVMEYCSGGDLYSLIITAGKLEYAEADCFFKQLVRAVHYMHNMGVAHRDLKPENLLLTADGTLKVTDFGNAECFKMAWEDEVQLSSGVAGSSPYIAPEEYVSKEFDARGVDVWACGVIYMAMRTGRQLWKEARVEDEFFGEYLKKRKDAKGYEPIEWLKRARCRNVVYSILDPVPDRRITPIQILNSEWMREIICCKN